MTQQERSILGYKLICTCESSPEQYEVFDSMGKRVAYLRLRFGRFTAESPDAGGDMFYFHGFNGDDYKGEFDNEDERRLYLTYAIEALVEYLSA